MTDRLKVIYDTDPGVDDAMALLLLARHPRIELIGVTTVFGNATIDTTTRNALYLKQLFGFEAPVARVAGIDVPLPYAANLEKRALPQPGQIVAAARAVCYRS